MVKDGMISVGDAWVDCGEIGNVPALANGVFAGRVIIDAAKKNDFTTNALSPVKSFMNIPTLGALKDCRDTGGHFWCGCPHGHDGQANHQGGDGKMICQVDCAAD